MDGQFSLLDSLFDTNGPRRLPVRILTHNIGFDLALAAPVADRESFTPYFHVPIPNSKDLASMIKAMNCGRCCDSNLRSKCHTDECPLCHYSSLRVVGGWV
ncbi:hypothetical protein C2E31_25425 [Rhodopirellula baltica]|nr:hypothetical protein C2E31_25425 [Rhodopirellula baltica]